MYICIHIHTYVCKYRVMRVLHVHTYDEISLNLHMCIYSVCAYTYKHICIYICVYTVYVHIHINTYVCKYRVLRVLQTWSFESIVCTYISSNGSESTYVCMQCTCIFIYTRMYINIDF